MRHVNRTRRGRTNKNRPKFEKIIMKCLCSGEQLRAADEINPSSVPHATNGYTASENSSLASEATKKPDTGNIEEAESSLRESGCLNYEEARALLGRYEYQKGNIEAALHVFEGIDISSMTPKIKVALARKGDRRRRSSQNFGNPPMSIHAVSLLLEAAFLKSKSLQVLGRFKEAAESCKVILDIVESSLPEGLPENFGTDCKLQETVNSAVELLPELWKLADCPQDAILSYRRALLHYWNLDAQRTARLQKEFAIFLLYSGGEANPPNLRSQMDSSFVPRNNLEEAILLLMILLKKFSLRRIEWDPSVLDHLSFALTVSGDCRALARQVEGILPGIIDRKETYQTLSLCYCGAGEDLVALNLLRKFLHRCEDPNCIPALLMASKICGESHNLTEDGICFARRAIECLDSRCDQLEGTANFLLGVSLSAKCKLVVADSDRASIQSEGLQALETAGKLTGMKDPIILYNLSLESAEQRKLDAALYFAKKMLKLEGGSNIRGWLLLARILSAQRRFVDAQSIVDAALEQTGKWDQGELLRTKAKLYIAQGQLRNAIETYTQLLAVLQVQSKSFGSGKKLHKSDRNIVKQLELDTWHDLAHVYIGLSRWRDAEICLSKSKCISPYSATRFHLTGVVYETKGLHKEALKAFLSALDIDPTHAPSLISTTNVLSHLGCSQTVAQSVLREALRLDRMNHKAWYNLGLLYKAMGNASSSIEAAECFEASIFLEESAPVEPFR